MLAYKPSELTALCTQLAHARWRQLVLIRGQQQWCYQQLDAIQQQLSQSWCILSKASDINGAYWPEHTHQILGQEHPFAVYDGYSGFYPDKFAALSGTVKAGGLLFLILPVDTESFIDQGISKLLSHATETPTKSHFWIWVEQQLKAQDHSYIDQYNGTRLQCSSSSEYVTAQTFDEQNKAIEAIIKTSNGRAKRPLLLCADRGRGKSAALGIAASQLPQKRIILCALQRRAVQTTFKHLALSIEQEPNQSNRLDNLEYMPPDKLLSAQQDCDVLFVDEAAAIPIPILKELVRRYPRVIFSSTLIGYEGSGRGYTLRFIDFLRGHYPNFKQVDLKTPIRFADHDPLEACVNQMLALDAQAVNPDKLTDQLDVVQLSPADLLASPTLLKQVFALLVLAHYQTNANDFRQLLDAPDQHLYVALQHSQPIAVCLVKQEGGLSQEIAKECSEGRRRIQGHLLAQTLANTSGHCEYMCHKVARISRIAVHPELHNQSVGSRVISFVEQDIAKKGYTIVGTSFGAYAKLTSFWLKLGYCPLKLGLKRDHVSAEHSIVMAKVLTNTNTFDIKQLSAQWYQDFNYQIPHFFSALPDELIHILLSHRETRSVKESDITMLARFIQKQVSFQQAYAPLSRALDSQWPDSSGLNWQLLIKLRFSTYQSLLEQYSKAELQRELYRAIKDYLSFIVR